MRFLLLCAIIGVIAWLTLRSISREKARRDGAAAVKARVRQTHAVDDLFVSPDNGSFVGLSADGGQIIVGKGEQSQAIPTASLLAVEGVRDEAVLVRAEPDGDPVSPVPVAEQGVGDIPGRIRRLGLRLTAGDEVFSVSFYEGGRHGVSPDNAEFRKQAALTEAWFRKLSTAMRLAR
ncbi:hypothetical protein [Brevundimonas sp. FT23042]|uniref:hypothetical protein n=1 Tax=Brevundimonas sp. FT23042 TaxID=3393749 RepID=UPI003B58A3BE